MKLVAVRNEAQEGSFSEVRIDNLPVDSYTVALADHCYTRFDTVVHALICVLQDWNAGCKTNETPSYAAAKSIVAEALEVDL